MPSFPGPFEVLVIAVIALLVFGPEKLPQVAKQVGRAAAELKRMASEVKDEFDSGFDYTAEDEERTTEEPPGALDQRDYPSAREDEGP